MFFIDPLAEIQHWNQRTGPSTSMRRNVGFPSSRGHNACWLLDVLVRRPRTGGRRLSYSEVRTGYLAALAEMPEETLDDEVEGTA